MLVYTKGGLDLKYPEFPMTKCGQGRMFHGFEVMLPTAMHLVHRGG